MDESAPYVSHPTLSDNSLKLKGIYTRRGTTNTWDANIYVSMCCPKVEAIHASVQTLQCASQGFDGSASVWGSPGQVRTRPPRCAAMGCGVWDHNEVAASNMRR